MFKTIFIDFETRSACDLKACGADVYGDHPTTTAWCLAWAIDEGPVEIWKHGEEPPFSLFNLILDGARVVAHNVAFELAVWNRAMSPRHGWPLLSVDQCECTQAMAYAMAIPASLEKAALAMGIDKQKDMAGSRVMMQLAQPRRMEGETPVWWEPSEVPEKFERLYKYCMQDVEVERELYRRLMKLSKNERRVWILDNRINQRGIQVDVPAVKTAIRIVEMEKRRLDAEMRRVTKGAVISCTATGQLTDWVKWQGVEIDGVAKGDIVELLNRDSLPGSVRAALLLRQEAAKSSTAKLQAMLDRAGDDGRIRGIFQYHGAGTGRWAGRGIQPQNFPRPKLDQNEIEQVFAILGAGA
jgi:DNA polymerase